MSNKLVNIKEVHRLYDATVWDNCALNGCLPKNQKGRIKDSSKFAEFFIDKIPLYPCFVPESVKNEYIFGMNPNAIKNTKTGKLIQKFQSEDRILSIENLPLGQKVKEVEYYCERLKEKYGISKTDSMMCAWTYELSNFFGSAAIISIDIKGIAKFWKELVQDNKINPLKVGFFPRRGLDLYEKFV